MNRTLSDPDADCREILIVSQMNLSSNSKHLEVTVFQPKITRYCNSQSNRKSLN